MTFKVAITRHPETELAVVVSVDEHPLSPISYSNSLGEILTREYHRQMLYKIEELLKEMDNGDFQVDHTWGVVLFESKTQMTEFLMRWEKLKY